MVIEEPKVGLMIPTLNGCKLIPETTFKIGYNE